MICLKFLLDNEGDEHGEARTEDTAPVKGAFSSIAEVIADVAVEDLISQGLVICVENDGLILTAHERANSLIEHSSGCSHLKLSMKGVDLQPVVGDNVDHLLLDLVHLSVDHITEVDGIDTVGLHR